MEARGSPRGEKKKTNPNVPTVAPIGRKEKCEHFSSPEKKEHLAESPRLGRPSRRPWALWGLPTLYVGVTLGLPWEYVGRTLGRLRVMSLAIPGRFWVILAESPVKCRDRRCVFYEMIDFPIRKRHFLVWWSVGGPWEPPGRKKRRNQTFLQDLQTFATHQISNFSKKSSTNFAN